MLFVLRKKLINILRRIGIKDSLNNVYYFINDLTSKNLLKRNKALKDRFDGADCHIIATGVSINDYDLKKIKSGIKFAIGMAQYHENLGDEYFDIYAVAEPVWSFPSKDYLLDFYGKLNEVMRKQSCIFIFRSETKNIIEKYSSLKGRNVFYINTKRGQNDIKIDLTKRVDLLQGSISFAIFASIYMGFKKIYLHGAGYTYSPQLLFHFYEENIHINTKFNSGYPIPLGYYSRAIKIDLSISKKERDALIKEHENRTGQKAYSSKETDGYAIIRYTKEADVNVNHQIINEFARNNGVKIYNVVPDGFESPVYEKYNISDVHKLYS